MNTKFRVVIVSREGKEIEMGWDMGSSSDFLSNWIMDISCIIFLFYVFLMCFFIFLICNVRKKIPQCLLFGGEDSLLSNDAPEWSFLLCSIREGLGSVLGNYLC